MNTQVKYADIAGGFFANSYVGFVPNKEAWDEELKRLGTNYPYLTTAGNCTVLDKKDGSGICILISVNEKYDDDPVSIVSILVHECVHAKQYLMEHIGEDNPSVEFEAYTVQYIFQEILKAYSETRGKSLQEYLECRQKKKNTNEPKQGIGTSLLKFFTNLVNLRGPTK